MSDTQTPDLRAELHARFKSGRQRMRCAVPTVAHVAAIARVKECSVSTITLISQPRQKGRKIYENPIGPKKLGPITMTKIKRVVANVFGHTPDLLERPGRAVAYVPARHVAMWFCYRFGATNPEVGLAFGGRDHSSIVFARQKIDRILATKSDPALIEKIEALETIFRLREEASS